jgi:hypothetical protein
MSASMPTRAESLTLRWTVSRFEKFEREYCCIVTFRFLKGHQDPYRDSSVQSEREFFFAPKQDRLYLDLSALLFAEGKAWTPRHQIRFTY